MTSDNHRNRTIAIASGKGGVGKTFLTANLGLALAKQISSGRVVVVDLDLGCSNLSTCLGVRSLNATVSDFLLERQASLDSVMTATEQRNLQLIGGSNGPPIELHELPRWKERLNEEIQRIESTFTILDLAAGSTPEVVDFFLAARDKVVAIIPESLSMQNGFTFIKTAILRLIDLELSRFEFLLPIRDKVREIVNSEESIELKMLLDQIRAWDVVAGHVVRGIIADFKIKIVINMYRGGQEKVYLRRFHNLLLKHLYMRNFEYLGIVHFGKNVRRTVQGMKPFLLSYPKDSVSLDLGKMASKLIQNQEDLEAKLAFPETGWLQGLMKK